MGQWPMRLPATREPEPTEFVVSSHELKHALRSRPVPEPWFVVRVMCELLPPELRCSSTGRGHPSRSLLAMHDGRTEAS